MQPRIVTAIERIEHAAALDPVVGTVRGVVNSVVRGRRLRDFLHGVPLGHPLHPMVVQLPIGAWMSAAVLDMLPRTSRASAVLIGVGIAGAAPAAVSGYTDWSELNEQQSRVGIIHSEGNVIALSLYAASLFQRSRGKQSSGKLLGFCGLAVVSGAGFLGGHLAYRQGAGVVSPGRLIAESSELPVDREMGATAL